jgi:hypothetical protein
MARRKTDKPDVSPLRRYGDPDRRKENAELMLRNLSAGLPEQIARDKYGKQTGARMPPVPATDLRGNLTTVRGAAADLAGAQLRMVNEARKKKKSSRNYAKPQKKASGTKANQRRMRPMD